MPAPRGCKYLMWRHRAIIVTTQGLGWRREAGACLSFPRGSGRSLRLWVSRCPCAPTAPRPCPRTLGAFAPSMPPLLQVAALSSRGDGPQAAGQGAWV